VMVGSGVNSMIFAAVMALIPGLSARLICFDTSIVDLTDQLADPVEVLFGVQPRVRRVSIRRSRIAKSRSRIQLRRTSYS
jgi:hypothetical protein